METVMNYHPVPDCSHKKAYETEARAEQVARHQEQKTPGLSLRVYYCDGCGMHHLTSRPLMW
jgi:hypothetical protein